jgi:hypothetical protein
MNATLSRRALTSTAVLSVLLLFVLCVLIAWKVLIDFSYVPANSLAGSARSTILTMHAFGLLIAVGLAGGVAALAYFLTGRNERAATAGSATILFLACCAFALPLVAYYSRTYRAPSRPSAASPGGAAPSTPADRAKEMQETAERQRKTMQESMDRLRQLGSQPPGTPPSTPPAGGTAPAASTPAAPRAPSAEELAAAEKARAALEPVRSDLSQHIADFLAKAQPFVDGLAKAPRALRSDLDKRIADAADMKQKAAELETFIHGVDARAEAALKAASLDMGEQTRHKIAFGQSINAFEKENACRTYQRFFDAGLEETQALRDAAGKWRTDANGVITCTDTSLQSRLRFLHEGVLRRSRDAAEAKAKLTNPL